MDTKPYGGWTKILAILCSRARTFKNVSLMIFFSSQFERSAGFLHIFARILVHPLEGHVTKLKLIKRQGYGRAGFPLLRKRVLHAF